LKWLVDALTGIPKVFRKTGKKKKKEKRQEGKRGCGDEKKSTKKRVEYRKRDDQGGIRRENKMGRHENTAASRNER